MEYQRETGKIFLFLSDEGPMLEMLDYTILIGSTPTFLFFDLMEITRSSSQERLLEKKSLRVKKKFHDLTRSEIAITFNE